MKELIGFETGKLAKEKGYNIIFIVDMPNGEPVDFHKPPTQSVLSRWLRENHGIHVESELKFMNGPFYVFRIKHIELGEMFTGERPRFDSYENAFEAGLQEALKLIKTP